MGFSVAPNRWRFDAGRSNRSLGQVLGIQQYNNLLYFDCALFPHAPQSWKSRYYFRWRLDLAAVHLTVALGRFAMDTSTVQQNGGCRIPWGRGEGTITSAGYCSTSFFCPSIYRRRRGSFRCASQCDTWAVSCKGDGAMAKGAAFIPLAYRRPSSCDIQKLFSCETCR